MPNAAKAAVIEFTGELPEPGKEFYCSESQECNQYSFLGAGFRISNLDKMVKEKFHTTKLSDVSADARYVYSECDGIVVNSLLIPETILAMIDAGTIDKDNGERPPIGPVAMELNDDKVFWYNDTAVLLVQDMLLGSSDEAKAYAKSLAELELKRE